MRDTVVLVPVKKNSSRLPSKNTRKFFNGKKLYEVTLELCALLHRRVIVSSDSDEVLLRAQQLNLQIHKRDQASANVDSPISQLVSQVHKEQLSGEDLLLLEVTSPLRHISLIRSAISYLESSDYQFAFSCQYFNSPPHKAMKVLADNGSKMITASFEKKARDYLQNHELQRCVAFNGLFYYYNNSILGCLPPPSSLISNHHCGALLTKRVVDIDNEDDFVEAQFLFEHGYRVESFTDLTI